MNILASVSRFFASPTKEEDERLQWTKLSANGRKIYDLLKNGTWELSSNNWIYNFKHKIYLREEQQYTDRYSFDLSYEGVCVVGYISCSCFTSDDREVITKEIVKKRQELYNKKFDKFLDKLKDI